MVLLPLTSFLDEDGKIARGLGGNGAMVWFSSNSSVRATREVVGWYLAQEGRKELGTSARDAISVLASPDVPGQS